MIRFIEKFTSFFSRKNVLTILSLITVLLLIMNMIGKLASGFINLFIYDIFFLMAIIFLYVSFIKHMKNSQKGLMGAILMWYLYDETSYAFNAYQSSISNGSYAAPEGISYTVLSFITVGLFFILVVNHFIINNDRKSKPINIFINQLIVIVIAVLSIISMIAQNVIFVDSEALTFESITWHIFLIPFVLMIASYEAVIDAYKFEREIREEQHQAK